MKNQSAQDQSQHTLEHTARLAGVGIHTGAEVRLELCPAEVDSGVVFERADLPGSPLMPARASYVVETRRGTTLGVGEVRVATVEHLLASLWALGVDNCRVRIYGPEVPILDGSALPFVEAIQAAGVTRQAAPCSWLCLKAPVEARAGEAFIRAEPALEAGFTYIFESPLPWLENLKAEFVPEHDDFASQIAPARTFGLESEARMLQEAGLAQGATLDNVLVLGETGYVNLPRFANEPAAHKLLDLLGDLALVEGRLQATVSAYKSGHTLNTKFADKLQASY